MRERTLNTLPLLGYATALAIAVIYLTGTLNDTISGTTAAYLFFTGAIIAIASERLDKHQGDKNNAAYLAARQHAINAHPSNHTPTQDTA